MRSPFQKRNRGQRKAQSTSRPSACPRRVTDFPGRLERLLTRATAEKSFLVVAIRILVRMLIGVHAPMHMEVVAPEDLVEENAEAMFLGVI
jgi:hypothetical protein